MKRSMLRWLALAALAWLTAPAAANDPVYPSQMVGCVQSAKYDASTNGATKLVTGNSTQRIYVCGWNVVAAGTVNVSLVYGTGGTCGTGQTAITPAYQWTAQTGMVDHPPFWSGLTPVPASNDLCLLTSAGVAVQAVVYYAQF